MRLISLTDLTRYKCFVATSIERDERDRSALACRCQATEVGLTWIRLRVVRLFETTKESLRGEASFCWHLNVDEEVKWNLCQSTSNRVYRGQRTLSWI